MEDILSAKARAKVNLHLQVLNKRSDNFHNLLTIMCEIELYDLLKLKSFKRGSEKFGISVDIDSGEYSHHLQGLPCEENLIVRGVKNLFRDYPEPLDMRFSLIKNIPSGAGLGGGSSDAACAINLAAKAIGISDYNRLHEAATATGSDVPFFLKGGLCIAKGRGEILKRIEVNHRFFVVMVNNGIHISTAEAYRKLNRNFDEIPEDEITQKEKELISTLEKVERWKDIFINDFEGPVFALYPELKTLKEKFYDSGAFFSLMSGSGSTVYGLFYCREDALLSMEKLKREGNRCFFAEMIAT
ncbi:MAG TPA: 4-(cytidine 5'-diphospho)-2-C-methyl-D-erythritol kinase [Spirochaetota bacterium]|nr:4-(cytidine 5'-diphospho)-2-C-methyl-D-erythritol kinase [Spirochaetota bacterium]